MANHELDKDVLYIKNDQLKIDTVIDNVCNSEEVNINIAKQGTSLENSKINNIDGFVQCDEIIHGASNIVITKDDNLASKLNEANDNMQKPAISLQNGHFIKNNIAATVLQSQDNQLPNNLFACGCKHSVDYERLFTLFEQQRAEIVRLSNSVKKIREFNDKVLSDFIYKDGNNLSSVLLNDAERKELLSYRHAAALLKQHDRALHNEINCNIENDSIDSHLSRPKNSQLSTNLPLRNQFDDTINEVTRESVERSEEFEFGMHSDALCNTVIARSGLGLTSQEIHISVLDDSSSLLGNVELQNSTSTFSQALRQYKRQKDSHYAMKLLHNRNAVTMSLDSTNSSANNTTSYDDKCQAEHLVLKKDDVESNVNINYMNNDKISVMMKLLKKKELARANSSVSSSSKTQSSRTSNVNAKLQSNVMLQDYNKENSDYYHFDIIITPEMHKKFSKLSALARGFLTRRLLHTEKVQHLIHTIRDCASCVISLYKQQHNSYHDSILQNRVLAQLKLAMSQLHDIFFLWPVAKRLALLTQTRQANMGRLRAGCTSMSQTTSHSKADCISMPHSRAESVSMSHSRADCISIPHSRALNYNNAVSNAARHAADINMGLMSQSCYTAGEVKKQHLSAATMKRRMQRQLNLTKQKQSDEVINSDVKCNDVKHKNASTEQHSNHDSIVQSETLTLPHNVPKPLANHNQVNITIRKNFGFTPKKMILPAFLTGKLNTHIGHM